MSTQLAPGTVVAGFQIESLLGSGAVSEVYQAREIATGHTVALKLLDRASHQDERFRARFLRESQLAASIKHPNVVSTIRSGEGDGRLYLAMELIEGTDLRRLLREHGKLDPQRAVRIISEAAAGLDAAHTGGLVHRDVKPGNILLDHHDTAYVCDFGLARHVASVSSLTGDRGFVGTIDYVPPEQIEGSTVDARADIYSLGCVLYETLTGTRPYDRDSELSVVFAHLNEPPPHPTDTNPELPAAFDTVITTALAKNPDERYSSAGELAAAARAALSGKVLARRRPRRRTAAALAVIAVAAAAIAGTVLLTGGSGTKLPVTITPTSIEGAKLGDSSLLLTRIWGGGSRFAMTSPTDYSLLTQKTRNVSAYFVGTDDKAVEIDTWNSRDRTAEGIGPCSTLAELRKAYGNRLKANPHSMDPKAKGPNRKVGSWVVGTHLLFSMTSPIPDRVNAVALFSNDWGTSNFNAANEAPCAAAVVSTPATRPKVIPIAHEPSLPKTFESSTFRPRITVRTPSGWSSRVDASGAFTLAGPGGTTLETLLDPRPLSPRYSLTPRGLTKWLRQVHGVTVSAPQTILFGKPVLTGTVVDLSPNGLPITYLRGPSGDLRAVPGERTRIYLAPIRIGSLSHTLALVLRAPTAAVFVTARAATAAIAKHLKVDAAAASNLSALSTECSFPFRGSCLGEVDAGTYSTQTMAPKLTYTVPVGWTNSNDNVGVFGLIPPGGDWTAVDFGKSDYIDVFTSIATGNGRCADGHGTIHTPEAFLRWLHGQPGVAPFIAEPASVGGLSGYAVNLLMRNGFTKPCPWSNALPAQQVLTGLPPSPDDLNHSLNPRPSVMRLYLLHYKGGTLGIEIDDVRGDSRMKSYVDVVKTFHFALG